MTDNTERSLSEAEGEAGSAIEAQRFEASEYPAAVEALLTVADEPLSTLSIATALSAPVSEVESVLGRLRAEYDTAGRGFELREVGGGWRLYVRSAYDELVRDFVLTQSPSRLSQAALETLAVIAYKQPVSRSAVAAVRAVNVDSVVRTLVSRGLITEVDSDPETGATLYGTTDLLLTQLGINSIDELPKVAPLLDDGADGFDDVN